MTRPKCVRAKYSSGYTAIVFDTFIATLYTLFPAYSNLFAPEHSEGIYECSEALEELGCNW
jgi:hypothetical protein